MKRILLNRVTSRSALVLCIVLMSAGITFAQTSVKFGNSYVNVTRKTVGGTVQPGDILEIRVNVYFPTAYNGNNIYYVRYVDNIPTNTTYAGDSLRLITNEGLTYKRWTNGAGDDAGTYVASPAVGSYNVRINIGRTPTAPANTTSTSAVGASYVVTGPSASRDKPRVGGGILITTSFKVQVTGAVGDTIVLGAGRFLYKKSNNVNASDTAINVIQYKILISNNDPICSNSIGTNFVSEAGGTFDSGTTQNRSYGPSFLIPSYTYQPLTVSTQTGDGTYAIVNNLSPYASTFQNAEKRPSCVTPTGGPPPVPAACANRMFGGHWDIIGDHTGTTTAAGRTPTASGSRGGYMLVVNADVITSEAYRQNITGLCPNTTYEYSLWIRNVCTNCGIDSSGNQTYRPGVLPNLTFAIDDLDRYSSGEVDTFGWMKKGFLFKTGMAQTSITISIRNNASGGGGNDWAIDDISLATCDPNLNLVPSGTANICYGNQVDISSTVTSFFNNYTYYRWEKSTDNGATFNVVGTGNGTPAVVGGNYEYIASFPSFLADSAAHMDQYRFIVGSTAANLGTSTCSFDASTVLVVWVNNCSQVLKTDLLSVQGKLANQLATIRWLTDSEAGNAVFEIERSDDGRNFRTIGTVIGSPVQGSSGTYSFIDPVAVGRNTYYRIKVKEGTAFNYSKLVLLGTDLQFSIRSLVNPFTEQVSFDVIAPEDATARLMIIDAFGKLIHQSSVRLYKGLNPVAVKEVANLAKGSYVLRLQANDWIDSRKIVKSK
jgi:hypothetical protein